MDAWDSAEKRREESRRYVVHFHYLFFGDGIGWVVARRRADDLPETVAKGVSATRVAASEASEREIERLVEERLFKDALAKEAE